MQHTNTNRWIVMVFIVLAGLLISACSANRATSTKIEPARLEEIEGSDLKRVILTEKAAERLGIETAPVLEEQVVRKRVVGGEVVSPDTLGMTSVIDGASVRIASDSRLLRVTLNRSELENVDRSQPVLVIAIDDDENEDDDENGFQAEAAEMDEAEDVDEPGDFDEVLYYTVDNTSLNPGQIVLVELTLLGSGTQKKVLPFSAVLYDVDGETWVYTNPEPLVFIRHPITIDYIEGDQAVLLEGPPVGTEVAMVGVAELFGTEFGVGK